MSVLHEWSQCRCQHCRCCHRRAEGCGERCSREGGLFLAGNTAGADWKFKGKVGKDISVQEGYETARQVGLIMLAKVRAALGSLDRVKRIVKVLGMVNSPEGFGDQPRVVNGFSDLMVESIRRAGRQARTFRGGNAGTSVQQRGGS
jgi:YjgF/chorismate_mutase-like, putative endoribonuclease